MDAIAKVAHVGLPSGRDVEVRSGVWHRFDDEEQVVAIFRLSRTPEGLWLADSIDHCPAQDGE